jgi:hypothetical protein
MSDCVPCPKCGGTGIVPVGVHLRDVLEILRTQQGDEMKTTQEIYYTLLRSKKIDASIGITAINNRLSDLLELDLIQRHGTGTRTKPYRWEAIK